MVHGVCSTLAKTRTESFARVTSGARISQGAAIPAYLCSLMYTLCASAIGHGGGQNCSRSRMDRGGGAAAADRDTPPSHHSFKQVDKQFPEQGGSNAIRKTTDEGHTHRPHHSEYPVHIPPGAAQAQPYPPAAPAGDEHRLARTHRHLRYLTSASPAPKGGLQQISEPHRSTHA